MSKQKLGSGNKRAVKQTPATSYTSARAIRLAKRRAEALDYRLKGRSYRVIGEEMKIHPSTAQDYVIRAMRDFVPREKAEQVLEMELQRLDQMQSAVYKHVAAGDIAAIEICLKISNQRARLLGLYPDKPSPVTLSFGGNVPNAEDVGIRVEFVRPSRKWDDDPRPIDIMPEPAPQLPRPSSGPEPVSKGPNILDFRKC
jgi:hypothetical protein